MPEQSVTLTFNQLKELIQEIRKPSQVEQEKLDAEAALKRRQQEQRVETARQEMASKAARESRCSHTKERGESAVYGQKHSDGLVHPICVRCQKLFPTYKPRAEDI